MQMGDPQSNTSFNLFLFNFVAYLMIHACNDSFLKNNLCKRSLCISCGPVKSKFYKIRVHFLIYKIVCFTSNSFLNVLGYVSL